jgi:hypothetical protein
MHGREAPGNIGMSVSVLTMGFWPTYPTVSAILPPEVKIFHLLILFLMFFLHRSFVDYKKSLQLSI